MRFAMVLIVVLSACAPLGNGALNEQEVITSMILTFTPAGGAPAITAEFDDPDGDGGELPTIQPIVLAPGEYTLAVRLQNRFEDPPEEITDEVRDEQDEHLFLFTGSATAPGGPIEQRYADMDTNGLPVGLESSVTARAGTGSLVVTLRHMPPELPPEKAADTVEQARDRGIDSLGGSTDATVAFMVTVQ
jgi:hypothetical protein